MGDVRDFLFKKISQDLLDTFIPLTKPNMTKQEFLVIFYNFIFDYEVLYMSDVENDEYFIYLCKYYINNSNFIDKEIFFMETLITEDPKKYLELFQSIEHLKDSYYGKIMLLVLEYTKEHIIIT